MKRLLIFSVLVFSEIYAIAQVSGYFPTDSLKGCWTFSGNANDSGPNHINGTIHGATLVADRHSNVNQAYQFNGTSNWIDLGDNPLLNPSTGDITVSAWIQTSSTSSLGARIFSKGTHGGTQPGYDIMMYPNTNGKIALIYCPGGGTVTEKQLYSNSTINNGQWHLITGVITRNGTMKLYIDAVLQNSQINISSSSTADIGVGTYNASIGASYSKLGNPNMPNEFFSGKIDQVAVWKRSLSECEIKALYYESPQASTVNPVVCESYTSPSGKYILNSSGTYTDTLKTSYGCDSIITINLTANPLPKLTIDSISPFINRTSGIVNLSGNPVGGTFYGNGVTGTIFNPLIAGCGKKTLIYTYTNENGCSNSKSIEVLVYDTISNLHIDTMLVRVTDTLFIDLSYVTGLSPSGQENRMKIYPNPTKQFITIDVNGYEKLAGYLIKITNSAGQAIYQNEINQSTKTVNLTNFTGSGIYFLNIIDSAGKTIDIRKIIIQ